LENNINSKLSKFSTQLYFGWVLFIGLLTLIPGNIIPDINWNFLSFDKIIHLTVFAILSFIGSIYFKHSDKKKTRSQPVFISFATAVLYGTLLEYLQTFIPQRGFDYADLTANIIGSLAGIVVFLLLNTKVKQ